MYFQKPGRKSEKKLEELLKILKTWKKFRKPGRNSENLEKISKKPLATLYIVIYTEMIYEGIIGF